MHVVTAFLTNQRGDTRSTSSSFFIIHNSTLTSNNTDTLFPRPENQHIKPANAPNDWKVGCSTSNMIADYIY